MSSGRTTISGSRNVLGQGISRLSYDVRRWLYVLLLLCLVSLLAFLYLAQAGYLAKQIEEMEALEDRLHELKQDNSVLLLQIARYEQMSRIKQEASALGLREPDHVEYVEVVVEEPAPSSGNEIAHDPQSSLPVASSYLPAWWHSAARQFRNWVSEGMVQAEQPGSGDSE